MPPRRASPPRRPTSTAQPHRTQPADQCPPATIGSVPPATSPQAPATTAPATTAPATTAPATRPRPPGSGHQAACHQHTPPTPPGHGHRHTHTHAHTHTHPGATRRRDAGHRRSRCVRLRCPRPSREHQHPAGGCGYNCEEGCLQFARRTTVQQHAHARTRTAPARARRRPRIRARAAASLPFTRRLSCASGPLRLVLSLSGLLASPRLLKAINGEDCGAKIEASQLLQSCEYGLMQRTLLPCLSHMLSYR